MLLKLFFTHLPLLNSLLVKFRIKRSQAAIARAAVRMQRHSWNQVAGHEAVLASIPNVGVGSFMTAPNPLVGQINYYAPVGADSIQPSIASVAFHDPVLGTTIANEDFAISSPSLLPGVKGTTFVPVVTDQLPSGYSSASAIIDPDPLTGTGLAESEQVIAAEVAQGRHRLGLVGILPAHRIYVHRPRNGGRPMD